jgi:KDO2-lipid IV(A) lauroyltransferase
MNTLGNIIIFISYKLFVSLVKLIPRKKIQPLLLRLAKLMHRFDKSHTQVAQANLNLVYQENLSEQRKEEIIKNSYINLVYALYEFIDNQNLNLEALEEKLMLENDTVLQEALKNERKIILVTAHYGIWEFSSSYMSLKYKPMTVVGRYLKNTLLNKDLQKLRESQGTTMLDKNGSAKELIKTLKKGNMVGLVIDQYSKHGIKVKFLGQDANMYDAPARMALKMKAVIIPAFFIPVDFGRYRFKFYDAIDALEINQQENIEDKTFYVTQKLADVISEQIFEEPDFWMWQHKRFKKFHDDIYR